MIDGKKSFDQPVKSNMITMITYMITYDNIRKKATGQGND